MRRNDASHDPERWTHAKLVARLREVANLETYGGGLGGTPPDVVREETRLYRESWLAPLLDEVERRMIARKPAGYVIRDLDARSEYTAYVRRDPSDPRDAGGWVAKDKATRFPTVHQAEAFAGEMFRGQRDFTIEKAG